MSRLNAQRELPHINSLKDVVENIYVMAVKGFGKGIGKTLRAGALGAALTVTPALETPKHNVANAQETQTAAIYPNVPQEKAHKDWERTEKVIQAAIAAVANGTRNLAGLYNAAKVHRGCLDDQVLKFERTKQELEENMRIMPSRIDQMYLNGGPTNPPQEFTNLHQQIKLQLGVLKQIQAAVARVVGPNSTCRQ